MNSLEFDVLGVQGKQRPRVGRGVVYTPSQTVKYEKLVAKTASEAMQAENLEKLECPVSVCITSYFEIPKSYSKKRKKECADGYERPTKKPDIDNIVKTILDGMNGVVYEDDKQVVYIQSSKCYTEEPSHVKVFIMW